MSRAVRAIFADACRRGELIYTVDAAGRPVWPPRDGLDWARSEGTGTVYATTTVRRGGEAPRDVSLVELDEGFRVMSRVEGVAPEDVAIGLRVRVGFVPGDDPVPVFRPA